MHQRDKMPRKEADYRISIKVQKTGVTHKIELIKTPYGKRYFVRYNNLMSQKTPDGATATWIINELRKILK